MSLFNRMMGHVNLMMDSGFEKVVIDTKEGSLPGIEEKTTINLKTGYIHAIKVVNYALMVATRLAGDEVAVEAEPEKIVLREIIYPHTGHTESSKVEWGPPIIAGEDEQKDVDPIIETGRPPLDLGPLPNGPVTEAFSTAQVDTAGDLLKADLRGLYEPNGSEDASYYCPWCEHKSKLAEGCHGKICCIKCGKPINSRFAQMLKKARQWDYIIMKEPVTSPSLAKHLGTSPSWAGKVLKELGWEPTRWRGVIWWRWNPPKEDGK